MPLLPSGVGTQSRYVIEALIESGKFQVISFGGAINHPSYQPLKVNDDWHIIPVDGYGDPDMIRGVMSVHKPDIVWFMTDPRFYEWLWSMENEIRKNAPLVYYHVWDNYPYPYFNKKWYDSNDYIASISKVTSNVVREVAPDVMEKYIPHAVDPNVFHPHNSTIKEEFEIRKIKDQNPLLKDKFVFFWNNRNARRKQPGSLLFWFKKFLDRVGHDKASLLMHTDVVDAHGQPLDYIAEHLGLNKGQVVFSTQKINPEELAKIYSMVDCTINISDAEGFGLATLESLSCGTPIIVNMTGGLQEQVTNGEDWFGIGLEPTSKAVIGSPQCPYIHEDRLDEGVVVNAMEKMFNMDPKDRRELGKSGREHVLKNYNFSNFQKTWVDEMLRVHDHFGSWETRKNYKAWECKEV